MTPTTVAHDPIAPAADPGLPTLKAALSLGEAQEAFARRLPALSADGIEPVLQAISIVSYKPGRRCVIEYAFDALDRDHQRQRVRVLGKIRTNRFGNGGYRQLAEFWHAGFDGAASDGIVVPEPLGTVPALRMWVQRRVEGVVATRSVTGPDGVALAARIAEAVHKLHNVPATPERQHRMADELSILERCLAHVGDHHPAVADRTTALMSASARLGRSLPEPELCGSHRDFYADQVIVDGARLVLLDFDLFCFGDPGLDVGNFLGHLTEQALRERGDSAALGDVETVLEDEFVRLAGEPVRRAVRVYAALTLARHVYLSSVRPDRAHLMPALLTLATDRVSALLAEGGLA